MTEMQISLTRENLDAGPTHERATFGLLEIKAVGKTLSGALQSNSISRNYQAGPYASGYHFAEWLCWNWWRLRWEPSGAPEQIPTFEWDMAHRMSDIGGGYRWPNITVSCDGWQCELTSERSHESDTPLFHYLGEKPVTVPAEEFEAAVHQFIQQMIQHLEEAKVSGTNLQILWDELNQERSDPNSSRFRRTEALLGFDPDGTDLKWMEDWLRDAEEFGENALSELATGSAGNVLSAQHIKDASASNGFEIQPRDGVRLWQPLAVQVGGTAARWGETAAWRIGVSAANALRQQSDFIEDPISDARLCEMAGISHSVVELAKYTDTMSWVLEEAGNGSRIALRAPSRTSRRFDIARLIGDRLFREDGYASGEHLSPATSSYSYRQKAQRAFAAELLSPWETVLMMLQSDHTEEKMERVADHFGVSSWTIGNLVRNNRGVSRQQADDEGFN